MKISIITPTYNRADLLERAIESILNQTHQNFEMLIVDDGSTDNTADVLEKYKEDNRIIYHRNSENKGVNAVRNAGLDKVSYDSQLITFLDSDDEFFPTALEDMINTSLIHPNVNCFRFRVIDSNDKEASNAMHINRIADFDYFTKNLFNIGEWVCTYRKVVLDNGFKYDETLNGFEMVAYINLARKEKQFFSDKMVRLYHLGHESISTEQMSPKKIRNSILGYKTILDRNEEETYKMDKHVIARLEYIISYLYALSGNKKMGWYYNKKAFCKTPFDLRFMRNLLKLI